MPKKTDNIIKLYRELLNGIVLEEVVFPKLDRDPEEYRNFVQFCDQVYTNQFFQMIVKNITHKQVEKNGLDSKSYEELQFGRATVNGIALFEELFKKYSLEFQEKFGGNIDRFNPNKGFSSVDNN